MWGFALWGKDRSRCSSRITWRNSRPSGRRRRRGRARPIWRACRRTRTRSGRRRRRSAAMHEAINNVNRYPDPGSWPLRHTLGEHFGLPGDHVICTNGSDELIFMLCFAFLREGDEAVMADGSFVSYTMRTASDGRSVDPRAATQPCPRPRRDGRRDHRADAAGLPLQPEQPDRHDRRRGGNRASSSTACRRIR